MSAEAVACKGWVEVWVCVSGGALSEGGIEGELRTDGIVFGGFYAVGAARFGSGELLGSTAVALSERAASRGASEGASAEVDDRASDGV